MRWARRRRKQPTIVARHGTVTFPCLLACDSVGLSFSVPANMKVLITGADGLLAYALKQEVPSDVQVVMLRRVDFDLTNVKQMQLQLQVHQPEVVINTAAYNMVDRCEVEREVSWEINATGPEKLADLCAEVGCKLVHYGTDYVFDGSKGEAYVETDAP